MQLTITHSKKLSYNLHAAINQRGTIEHWSAVNFGTIVVDFKISIESNCHDAYVWTIPDHIEALIQELHTHGKNYRGITKEIWKKRWRAYRHYLSQSEGCYEEAPCPNDHYFSK